MPPRYRLKRWAGRWQPGCEWPVADCRPSLPCAPSTSSSRVSRAEKSWSGIALTSQCCLTKSRLETAISGEARQCTLPSSTLSPSLLCSSIPGNMTMETVELHFRAFMMKLIALDGALSDIENVEGELVLHKQYLFVHPHLLRRRHLGPSSRHEGRRRAADGRQERQRACPSSASPG